MIIQKILGVLSCVGLLTVAGACGVAIGWIEKKYMEEEKKWNTMKR